MDLAVKMIKLAGFVPKKDIEIEITGLRPGEKLYEELISDTSKALPTHHDKIMIGKDLTKDFNFVDEKIIKIIEAALRYDDTDLVKKLKNLVPEFISKNSEYEDLDENIDIRSKKENSKEIEFYNQ